MCKNLPPAPKGERAHEKQRTFRHLFGFNSPLGVGGFCFLFLFPIFLQAQITPLSSLTTEDGLSQGMIFDILKDQEGFIWIATKNGLNRYDGYDFKVFTHNPFDSLSISGDELGELFIDSRGLFWVGTQARGLNLFDKNKGLFYAVSGADMALNKKLANSKITRIIEDQEGNIWICTLTSVFVITTVNFAENGAPIFELTERPNSKEEENGIVHMDKTGQIWLIGEDDLYYWETKLNDWISPEIIKAPQSFGEEGKRIIFIKQGKYYHPQGQILYEYEQPSFLEKLDPIKEGQWRLRLHLPELDKYLLASQYSPTIYLYDSKPSKKGLLDKVTTLKENEYPTAFFLENDRTLWIGTNGYGIRKFNLVPTPFQHYAEEKSISSFSLLPKHGIFAKSILDCYQADFGQNDFSLISEKYNLPKEVMSITPTKDNKYWAIVRSFKQPEINGLRLLDENLVQEKFYQNDEIQARYGLIQEDAIGNLWMPSQTHDFVKFDVQKETYTHFNLTDIVDIPKPNNFTQCLYKDGQGVLWKGVKNGLLKIVLDAKGQIQDVKFYQSNPRDLASLSNNSVASCLDDPFDPETYLWVGTKGGGLNKLNKQTGNFEHFTTKDGLPDNVVYGILADDENKLWLSTNRGLSQFDPIEKTFKNYRAADGLQDDEFNTSAYAKDPSTGKLYFGGINGLTIFYPKDLSPDTTQAPVYVTNLKIHNEEIVAGKELKEGGKNPLQQDIIATKEIELEYHQNQLSFEFAALDYDIPEKNLYEYQLHPVDLGWVRADKNRLANYANLASGDYVFRVRGSNSSGFWNENPTELALVIHPPWWATWWAYLFYFMGIIVGIYQISQFQVRREKLKNELNFEQKEAERQAEINRVKTNFFSNITHEFRTPLTLILEPLRQLMKEEHTDKTRAKIQLAKNNSERLLQLVNQLLDVSKLEAQKMAVNFQKGNFLEVVEPIFQSFLPLAEKKNIELKLFTPKALADFYFDKNHIEKIITNLLSNALKFTDQGTIFFKITKEVNLFEEENDSSTKNLIISVIDRGIGISEKELPHIFDRFYQAGDGAAKTKKGTGIGLALTKELTELMGGEISVKSTVGKGTTFMVKLPMRFLPPAPKGELAHGVEGDSGSIEVKPIKEERFIPKTNQILFENGANSPSGVGGEQAREIKSILLIEDNDELRTFIRQSIEKDYEVEEASDGAEGIEKALQIIPDLIISDLMMPKKDGFEVVKTLKNNVLTSHIPIILLTAKSAIDSKLEGLRGGADEYLTKPFNTEELLIRMENLMEIRAILRAKFQGEDTHSWQKILKKREGMAPIEVDFVNKLNGFIEENLGNSSFSVEILAEHAGMSRSQLFRKLKGILSQTPNEYIRNYRLDHAKKLLQKGGKKVNEVATEVGFSDEKYFSKRFKKRFGVLPSEI